MKKKLVSLLLCLAMALSLLPTAALAEDAALTPELSAAVTELETLAEGWGLDELDHDLDLPESTSNGCEVEWTSSRANSTPGLTNAGVIKRPYATASSGTAGTLTATVYHEADSAKKVFNYTLKPIAYDELEAPAKEALEELLPDMSSVTGDLTLFEGAGLNAYPTSTSYTKGIVLPIPLGGVNTQVYITVASDNEAVIGEAAYSGSAYGKNGKIDLPVTRPAADTAVKLTFTIKASNSVAWTVEKTANVKAAAAEEALQAAKAAAETAFAAIADYDGTNLESIRSQVNAALAAREAAVEAGWKLADIENWANYGRIAAAQELLSEGNKTVSITVQGYNKGDLYPGGDGSEVAYFVQGQPFVVGNDWTVYQVLAGAADLYGWTLGGSSNYVSAIAGLGEKMLGATSGWMYMVNTTGYINVGMGGYRVSDGDNILIYYVKGWGSGPACSFDEIKEWKQGKDAVNLLTGGDNAKALESDWETIRTALDANGEWYEDLPLAVRGKSGSRVVWTSSDPAVVSAEGKVTRGAEAKTVTLTADLYLGGAHVTKTYEVKIGGTGGITVTVQIVGKDADSSLDSWTGTVASFDLTTLDSTITYNKYGSYVKPVHALLTRLNAIEGFKFNDKTGLKTSSGGYASANIDYLLNVNNASGRKWTMRVADKDGEVRVKDVATSCYFGYNLSDGDTVSFVYAAKVTDLKSALDSAANVPEDQYTAESYAALKAAKEAGQAEYDKGLFADQTTVDECTAALNAALAALVPNEDLLDKLPGLLDALNSTTNWTGGNGDGWGVVALHMAGRTVSDEVLTKITARADNYLKSTSSSRPDMGAVRNGAALTALGTDLNYYIPAGGTRAAMDQMSYSYLLTGQNSTSYLNAWLLLNETGSYPEWNGVTRAKVEERLLSFYKDSVSGWPYSKTSSSFDINSTIWAIAALAPTYLDESSANHADVVAKVDAAVAVLKTKMASSTAFATRAEAAIALMRIGKDPEADGLNLISGQRAHLLADGSGFTTNAYGNGYNANTPTVVLSLVMYQQYKTTGKAVNFISWRSGYDLQESKDALKAALDSAAALAEADYTAESYAALAKAMADGEAALVNIKLTAAEVPAFTTAVEEAVAALEKAYNADAINALITEAKAVDPDIAYTQDSKDTLAAALEYAESLVNSETQVSQSELNAAAEALQEALGGLVVAGEGEIAPIIKTITDNWLGEKDTFTDDWRVVDMAILGRAEELFTDEAAQRKYVSAAINRINPQAVTDYERVLLAVTALGVDGSKLDEYRTFYDAKGGVVKDLVAAIGAFPADQRSVNGATFALLAYDSGEYTVAEGAWSRDSLVAYLLDAQLTGGGWNLTQEGTADPDVTAMAVTALAPYLAKDGVSAAVDKAMAALAAQASKTCTFASYETVNSNSSAMVMLAQLSLGRNPDSDAQFNRWSKGQQYSVVDGLLSFKTTGNLFGYDSSRTANVLSTEQGLRALAAYRSYLYSGQAVQAYQFGAPAAPEKWDEEPVALTLELTSLPVKLTYQVGEALDVTGIAAKVTFSDGTVIQPPVSELTFVGFDSATSGTRTVRVNYGNVYATFTVTVEGSGSSGDDSDREYVYLRVADPQGVTYLERTAYVMERGETAFSLLGRSGLDYRPNFNTQYEGVYVEAIAGLGEFDEGAQSGWMYRVNGSFPQYSASLYNLKAGDYVEWLYTRDLGKDLGALDNTGTGSIGGGTAAKGDPAAVVDLIDKIGTVTKDSGAAISAARKAYDALTEAEKAKVTNYKTLTEAEAAYAKLAGLPFTDVAASAWYFEAVRYAYEKGLFTGTTASKFSPDGTMDRAMLVTVLHRLAGTPAEAGGNAFADVAAGSWYEKAVAWASSKGIVTGVSETSFAPETGITREQLAAMLYRYAKAMGYDVSAKADLTAYNDGKAVSDWAADAMAWAVGEGLITGRTATTLAPQGGASRAEVATILWRFCEKTAK